VPSGGAVLADGVPLVVSSKTQRDALDKYVGLSVIRTDMTGIVQRWDGSAWRYLTYGVFTGTTDGNGLVSFGHGGEDVPASWLAMPTGQQTDPLTLVLKLVAWAQAASTLTVRAVRDDTNAYFPGTPVKFFWVAYF
jgi:hypothetical protein